MFDSRLIDSRVLATAFHNAVRVSGDRSVNLLIEDIKYYGAYFDQPEFDLQRLSSVVNDLIGETAGAMIFERFGLELGKIG